MSGIIPLISLKDFMACPGTNLQFIWSPHERHAKNQLILRASCYPQPAVGYGTSDEWYCASYRHCVTADLNWPANERALCSTVALNHLHKLAW
jgi:hypothetical protein